MIKSNTSNDLSKMDTLKGATPPNKYAISRPQAGIAYDPQPTASGIAPTAEWLKNPINVGSIYIKPTEERRTYSQCIFQYCWWYLCCDHCCK